MKNVTIEVQVRTETGKGVARTLRRAGQIPGVLYGAKIDPIALSVNAHEFNNLLISAKGERILFAMNLKNNGDGVSHSALIKELQLHPVNDHIRHIDFYEVFMDQEVQVEIPLTIAGKAKGVEDDLGILEIIQRTVKVSCLPTAIPRDIQIDVSDLGLGDALHVADVTAPEGVSLLNDSKMTLVTVVSPAIKEEVEEEEEEETEIEAEDKEETT